MLKTVTIVLIFVGASSVVQAIEINIVNRSEATIRELYVASDEATEWGDDRLGDDRLGPKASATVSLEPGSYEVRLVDEKQLECKIADSFVTSNPTWDITDESVSRCERFGGASTDANTDATKSPGQPKSLGSRHSSPKIAHASSRQPK